VILGFGAKTAFLNDKALMAVTILFSANNLTKVLPIHPPGWKKS